MKRCGWARSPAMVEYHDREWGVPVHEDRVLFEFITLEGAQAGLSWETILNKREAYRRAFAGFDPAKVARFTAARRARLMQDAGIVRNRLKIDSTVRKFPGADALNKDLKRRGFRFVGTTICYAFMQAVGIVNDHTVGCFRRKVS